MKKLIATTLTLLSVPAFAAVPTCDDLAQIAYEASAMYQSGYSRYYVESNQPQSGMLYDRTWPHAVNLAVSYFPERYEEVQEMINEVVRTTAKLSCEEGQS